MSAPLAAADRQSDRRMDPRDPRELLHAQSDFILEPPLEMSPGEANPPRDASIATLPRARRSGERVIDRAGPIARTMPNAAKAADNGR